MADVYRSGRQQGYRWSWVGINDRGKYSFRWLLDENEDGVVDRVAIDKMVIGN